MTQAIPSLDHPRDNAPTGSLLSTSSTLTSDFRRELGNALLKSDGAMLFLSVDQIQLLIHQHGPKASDKIVNRILDSIRHHTRSSDVCCRYHNHIVIMLANTSVQKAHLIADRLQSSLANLTLWLGKEKLRVTVSIGYTGINRGDNRESILDRADLWLSRQYQLFQTEHKNRQDLWSHLSLESIGPD